MEQKKCIKLIERLTRWLKMVNLMPNILVGQHLTFSGADMDKMEMGKLFTKKQKHF